MKIFPVKAVAIYSKDVSPYDSYIYWNNRFDIYNEYTIIKTSAIQTLYIHLPNFNKPLKECNEAETWLYFMKYSTELTFNDLKLIERKSIDLYNLICSLLS